MSDHDLIIRNGTIYDGLGGAPFVADIGVRGETIADIGRITGKAPEEIDAAGRIVAPGWVDIHTHYDGQATWDSRLQPSSNMGVTTVVMGNCGVGFAPVRATDREALIGLMEGVEDIPGAALHEGLQWNWESFDEYLGALERIPHDVDVGAQVPHGALRVYVMGERGRLREPAAAEDRAAMRRLVEEGLRAGALGFSSSRTIHHRTVTDDYTPSFGAAAEELIAIAEGMAAAGSGVMQYTTDNADEEEEWSLLCTLARTSGRPLSVSMTQQPSAPDKWRRVLARIESGRAAGLKISAQVPGRSIGLLIGLQSSSHPFIDRPSYQALAHLPLAERVERMKQPDVRAGILSEPAVGRTNFLNAMIGNYDRIFPMGDPPDYEPDPRDSVGGLAWRTGADPQDVLYDAMIAHGGRDFLYLPKSNYVSGDLEVVRKMLEHPYTLNGLSDGGAHVGLICDASMSTYFLTHWARDRARGDRLDLARLIRRQTHDTATAVGLRDRGLLRRGYRADLNVIDYDNLQIRPPEMRYDLPTGARRLHQEARGYDATVLAGAVTYRNGEATGALPGKVIRGRKPEPSAPPNTGC